MKLIFLYYVDKSGGSAIKNAYCFFVYAAFCLKRLFYIFRAFLLAVEYYQHFTVLPFIIMRSSESRNTDEFSMCPVSDDTRCRKSP